jgi:hypothetical protein
VDEPDRDGVEEVELLPASPLGGDETGLLEHAQVLHHAEARHRQPLLQRAQRLPVFVEEGVKQLSARGVGEGLENCVHDQRIGD